MFRRRAPVGLALLFVLVLTDNVKDIIDARKSDADHRLLHVLMAGIKSYQPAFWSLPSLFLTEVAAGSIGLINSIGNLGGYFGPSIMGEFKTRTGSFEGALYCLCFGMAICATIIFLLGLGRREARN